MPRNQTVSLSEKKQIDAICFALFKIHGKHNVYKHEKYAEAVVIARDVLSNRRLWFGSYYEFLRHHKEKLIEFIAQHKSKWLPGRKARGSKTKPVQASTSGPSVVYIDGIDVASVEFLSTFKWRRLRLEALIKYGRRCVCCGITPEKGGVMHVDHIKPRKLFPALALDIKNLQVLCQDCNHGKGNWNHTDWRPK